MVAYLKASELDEFGLAGVKKEAKKKKVWNLTHSYVWANPWCRENQNHPPLSIYIYIYIYVYTYVYIDIYVRTYTYSPRFMRIIHICMYTYVHIYTYMYVPTFAVSFYVLYHLRIILRVVYIYVYIHSHTYIYIHIYMHTHANTCHTTRTHLYTRTYILIHIFSPHAQIYTHMYMYIHIFTYTHTHTCHATHTRYNTYIYIYTHTYTPVTQQIHAYSRHNSIARSKARSFSAMKLVHANDMTNSHVWHESSRVMSHIWRAQVTRVNPYVWLCVHMCGIWIHMEDSCHTCESMCVAMCPYVWYMDTYGGLMSHERIHMCLYGIWTHERWGAGVETQKNVRGEIGGWGRVPFNETYALSLSTIYDGA